jgi:hypothetical protein
MHTARILSLLLCSGVLVFAAVAAVRGFRLTDADQIRALARRVGRIALLALALALAIYVIAAVGNFAAVAAEANPQDKVAALARGLEEPGTYLRESLGALLGALIGVAVLRGRASYLS